MDLRSGSFHSWDLLASDVSTSKSSDFSLPQNHLESLLKYRSLGPISVPGSVILKWGPGMHFK